MLNVTLASDHLYGKLLSIWLSLVMSLMASLRAVLFPMSWIRSGAGKLSQFLRVFLPTFSKFKITIALLEKFSPTSTSHRYK